MRGKSDLRWFYSLRAWRQGSRSLVSMASLNMSRLVSQSSGRSTPELPTAAFLNPTVERAQLVNVLACRSTISSVEVHLTPLPAIALPRTRRSDFACPPSGQSALTAPCRDVVCRSPWAGGGQLICAVRPMGTRLHVCAASDDVNPVEVGCAPCGVGLLWAVALLKPPPQAVRTGGLTGLAPVSDRTRPVSIVSPLEWAVL